VVEVHQVIPPVQVHQVRLLMEVEVLIVEVEVLIVEVEVLPLKL
jgi:hypothetical protein